jgi:hypothetical protein
MRRKKLCAPGNKQQRCREVMKVVMGIIFPMPRSRVGLSSERRGRTVSQAFQTSAGFDDPFFKLKVLLCKFKCRWVEPVI